MIEDSLNLIKYPYGIISDVHCHNWSAFSHTNTSGINNRLQHILDGINLAARSVICSGGRDLVITGDLFHTRGSVKPSVLNPTFDLFRDIAAKGIRVHAIPGNHDLEGKNSDRLGNAFTALTAIREFNVYDKPTYLHSNHLFIPWIEESQEVLKLANQKVLEKRNLTLFAHVGLNGVVPGHIGNTLDPTDFSEDFKYVFCGHFHNHVDFNSRVYSVGALTHQTWNDVGSKAGFLIVYDDDVKHEETLAPRFIDYNLESKFVCSGNYIRIKGIELTGEEAAKRVNGMKRKGALAVLDQSTRPTIVNKTYAHEVKTELGLDAALEAYCRNTFGEKWESVYNEALRMKR